MSKKLLTILAYFLMMPVGLLAENDNFGSKVVSVVKKVGTFLDSMSVNGLNRNYIDAPKRPWQIILRGNINQSDLKLFSKTDKAEEVLPFMEGYMTWEPRIKTDPSSYIGFWAGYRGYGFGYSWNIGGDDGRILSFGATGGCYGVNLRIHWFETDEPHVYMIGSLLWDITDNGKRVYDTIEYDEIMEVGSPIKTRSLFLDGYYLFNKKCSYAAAYDQSVIQKRSAGSLMAGAMYFYSNTEYDTDINADMIMLMNDIGRIRSWQASAGVGYIYNWVPAKGLLISAMAIPMVTFYNHHKMYFFDSNFKDTIQSKGWLSALDIPDGDYKIRRADKNPEVSKNSNIQLNFDARLSITYEWNERLFINAYGQFGNFRYKTDHISGRLNDWYVNAALGIRL